MLASMTGFARRTGAHDGAAWTWELRSVNARHLDVRAKLPNGSDALEADIRPRVAKVIARGNVQCALQMTSASGALPRLTINRDVLSQVLEALQDLETLHPMAPAQATDILSVRGVMEYAEANPDPTAQAALNAAILTSLDEAVADLVAARHAEGSKIGGVLSEILDQISATVDRIAAAPGRDPEAIRQRLATQIERWLSDAQPLEPARLHQEAVLAANRADIQEEIDRLQAHVASAHEHLASGVPCGRALDFLCQEFNREANTICSKAGDLEVTQAGLALKTLIEQLREQVQNIE